MRRPKDEKKKKIGKIARNGAYALGGGLGLWFMNALYPYEESAARTAQIFAHLAIILIIYGLLILATVLFRRNWAGRVNLLLNGLALPAALLFVFSKFWSG